MRQIRSVNNVNKQAKIAQKSENREVKIPLKSGNKGQKTLRNRRSVNDLKKVKIKRQKYSQKSENSRAKLTLKEQDIALKTHQKSGVKGQKT